MEPEIPDDVSDDTSKNECLICITECDTLSSDLFLYNCTCVYYVHKQCMINWRQISKTDRVCLICHITIDDFNDKNLQVIRYRPPQRPLILGDEQGRHCIGMFIRFIFLPFTFCTIMGGIIIIMSVMIEKIRHR
jgi:hypothetical protein